MKTDSPAARLLAAAIGSEDLTVVDVGCSGGIHPGWDVFGDRLRAYGFDPAIQEIARLSAIEARPGVRYINGFVGLPQDHPLKGADTEGWRANPWLRTSTLRTQQIQRGEPPAAPLPILAEAALPDAQPQANERAATDASPALALAPDLPSPVVAPVQAAPDREALDDQQKMARNLWTEAALVDADRLIFLPAFLAEEGVKAVDFIKIDVDGPDFEILQSLTPEFGARKVLGAVLEVSYCGDAGPHCNSFHNTDRLMRAQGFHLFGLSVRRYSMAALPAPYVFPKPYPAQTMWGRPFLGDALYLRDVCFEHAEGPEAWSDDAVLKLAALYALFQLPDQAAELLLKHRRRLDALVDVDAVLDALTMEAQALTPGLLADAPMREAYASYMAAFEADDDAFYDADQRLNRAPQVSVAQAQAVAHTLQSQLEQQRVDHAAANAALEAMTKSLSWRVTAPLRAASRLVRKRGS